MSIFWGRSRSLMRVDVLVFRGDALVSGDPYLSLGHVGVRFRPGGDVFGFGPTAAQSMSHGSCQGAHAPGAFSRHTPVFQRALSIGLPVVEVSTCCPSLAVVANRLRRLSGMGFALPGGAYRDSYRGVATNCVGFLRLLGVVLPGSSLYVGEVVGSVRGARWVRRLTELNPVSAAI